MRRVFVDPASISSGWAYFDGNRLIASGTVAAPKSDHAFKRLVSIARQYQDAFLNMPIEEVHIEQLPGRCHYMTHWSVGVIGTALKGVGAKSVAGDVPVKSWQKAVGWTVKNKKVSLAKNSPLRQYVGLVKSEDQLAALGLGIYWTQFRKE